MAVSRTHRYTVDPADLEELIARRTTVIAAIRAAHPGLTEARLTRLEDGTYTDVWRWDSAPRWSHCTRLRAASTERHRHHRVQRDADRLVRMVKGRLVADRALPEADRARRNFITRLKPNLVSRGGPAAVAAPRGRQERRRPGVSAVWVIHRGKTGLAP
jgi:hypothetical protein